MTYDSHWYCVLLGPTHDSLGRELVAVNHVNGILGVQLAGNGERFLEPRSG